MSPVKTVAILYFFLFCGILAVFLCKLGFVQYLKPFLGGGWVSLLFVTAVENGLLLYKTLMHPAWHPQTHSDLESLSISL